MSSSTLTGVTIKCNELYQFTLTLQLAKVSYYSYLGSQVLGILKTESDFISQSALAVATICIIFSIYLIFTERIHFIYSNLKQK